MTSTAPIGVFDSGLGGISVVRQIVQDMPHERVLYFGDSANAPYGTKTPQEVRRLSFDIMERFMSQGVKAVVIADLDAARLAEVAADIGCDWQRCDVTSEASVQKAVDEVLGRAGRIDLLVNNAGIGLLGGAEESSEAQAKALFDVNVFGVLRMTNAILPVMRRQRKGRIVNLSSILGLIWSPAGTREGGTSPPGWT